MESALGCRRSRTGPVRGNRGVAGGALDGAGHRQSAGHTLASVESGRYVCAALVLMAAVAGCSSAGEPVEPTEVVQTMPTLDNDPPIISLPEQREEPTQADVDLVNRFIEFANDPTPTRFESLPLADDVVLALATNVVRVSDKAELQEPAGWLLDVGDFGGVTGPFSALNYLGRLRAREVSVGPHDHCAGPPRQAPVGLEGHRRISVQPNLTPTQSCLAWSTVDFFIGQSGEVEGISVDFWEPRR